MPSAVPRARAWRQTRSARATPLRWARPRPATSLKLRWAHAREPTQWPHAGDRYRATHRALVPARLPSYADYILRLQDTESESLEIMLRLLLVALPLVVALPAAFDKQEANALHCEVQSPLQLEVRSPPNQVPPSSPPAATRDQHDSPTTAHSTPHAHHPPSAHISLSPRVRHITAHTHPCSTHLHLHRTHHTLTSPPATRSPLPPQRPCPC
jgi:hypothetical protein